MLKLLKNDLDLESVLFSGQCFRVLKENEIFTIILNDRVVYIKEDNKYLIVESSKTDNLEEKLINYFDLNRDYESINMCLTKKDSYMKTIVYKCKGFKILKQDPFEIFISYIISQNNSVKRISNSVEKISKKYGKKITFKNKEYFLFPNIQELLKATEEELNQMGLGYRSKYIINALKIFTNDENFLEKINNLNTKDALNYLMKLNGIGLKVASCILLFAFERLDVFPIDTWVKKNIINNYKNIKPNYNEIQNFAKRKFGKYSGVAIQYMFHSQRNIKK